MTHLFGPGPLFIVGAQKAGTSSLAAAIGNSYAEVEVSLPKEPMVFSLGDFDCHRTMFADDATPFFADDAEKRRLFAACFHGDQRVKLDASTSYMISPEACKAIARNYPGARAIVMLRDPMARMVSAYWHYVRTGVVCHDFDRAIEFGPSHLVNCGFYRQHLQVLFSTFGRERVLVASDRHVYSTPEAFASLLEKFAGLRPSPFVLGRDNAGSYPRLVGLQLLANYMRQRSDKNFRHGAKSTNRWQTYGLLGGAAELLTRLNIRASHRPRLHSRLVPRLLEIYRRENAGLDALLDFGDTGHWYQDYSRYFLCDGESVNASR